jgi:hypothetical protein
MGNLFVNTWEIAPSMGGPAHAFRALAAYHQGVHVQMAAALAASISELGLGELGPATGAAAV